MKKALLLLLFIVITSCYQETSIIVEGDFTTSYVNDKESVPVIIKIESKITGADKYEWTFEGGSPSTSSLKNPGEVLYDKQGNYTIKLKASNADGESKEISKTVVIRDGINIDFTPEVLKSNYPPVEISINNNTLGEGLTFNWDFQEGIPVSFSGKTPPNIIFTTPGEHTITLTVSNGVESQKVTKTIVVAPLLVSIFSYEPKFENDDYQSPVTINFTNKSVSAVKYKWTFQGGNPSVSTEENPTVIFTSVGTHEVTLEASNDKTNQIFKSIVTVQPDTNLRILTNIKLGINSAHNNNNIGAMFSTVTRQVYKANEINEQNSNLIDIVFQGLNGNLAYNKFISPDQVNNYGFLSLKNAQSTIFVNSQNLCNCGLNFTEAQFDAMVNDTSIKALNISYSAAGEQQFGFTYPRIILFKTQDGRKGAIKIKYMVKNGTSSYILCDIKVQKQ
ncbi:PKD domain-containing protein [Flavobacterium sp. ANB]|uniref:PKD domain-containing protein n=1 Tax=unclassified Flavobacterium TaxID=196869 RepID=UPI0012B87A20|nr:MULTISPECIES: PKD domain-containing protein [unclassified Flavobacterium]MBF4516518.1 PKD domain-containing protein [Flavobacterium sp. ANB]MTD69585.1 PKD domain-containing protein [Flavobacterium sp. LC2016-13]